MSGVVVNYICPLSNIYLSINLHYLPIITYQLI